MFGLLHDLLIDFFTNDFAISVEPLLDASVLVVSLVQVLVGQLLQLGDLVAWLRILLLQTRLSIVDLL